MVYFAFLKYLIFILFVLVTLGSIPQMSLSFFYNRELENYCSPKLEARKELCDSLPNRFTDLLYKSTYMSYHYYVKVSKDFFEYDAEGPRYDILNITVWIVLIVVNCLFITLFYNMILEADIEEVTPSDYTLMISRIPRNYSSLQNLNENILEMVFI